jgi:hypothetical protein
MSPQRLLIPKPSPTVEALQHMPIGIVAIGNICLCLLLNTPRIYRGLDNSNFGMRSQCQIAMAMPWECQAQFLEYVTYCGSTATQCEWNACTRRASMEASYRTCFYIKKFMNFMLNVNLHPYKKRHLIAHGLAHHPFHRNTKVNYFLDEKDDWFNY